MKYSGKLYGKVAGHFIPLEATSEDVIIIGEPMKPQQVADLLNCYVSMDADGYWWWHVLEPKIEESCWVDDGSWDEHESFGLIVPDLIDWEGDWKDSLHKPRAHGSERSQLITTARVCYTHDICPECFGFVCPHYREKGDA